MSSYMWSGAVFLLFCLPLFGCIEFSFILVGVEYVETKRKFWIGKNETNDRNICSKAVYVAIFVRVII